MMHPTDDALLLHAWGELPDEQRAGLDAHLAGCEACRARFTELEESRVALAWGAEPRVRVARRGRRLAWLALPMAAAIGAILLTRRTPEPPADRPVWQPHVISSATAGYVAGGPVFIGIDSQLTRLEQGGIHGSPRN